jgi:hypothetical protein
MKESVIKKQQTSNAKTSRYGDRRFVSLAMTTSVRVPTTTNTSTVTTTNTTETTTNVSTATITAAMISPLDDVNLLRHILSFVGKNQYRFVATINHHFKAAYHQTFPYIKQTYINASTVEHATISYHECIARKNHVSKQRALCQSAARYGNIAALQYLRSMNCSWNSTTCAVAATNGHLRLLQWARASGCPWGNTTCAGAAENGHLSVLQWARANRCPWDIKTCTYAARNGHLAVLQWLEQTIVHGIVIHVHTLHVMVI